MPCLNNRPQNGHIHTPLCPTTALPDCNFYGPEYCKPWMLTTQGHLHPRGYVVQKTDQEKRNGTMFLRDPVKNFAKAVGDMAHGLCKLGGGGVSKASRPPSRG